MLRWIAKGVLLLLLAGATVAVVVRVHRPASGTPPIPGAEDGAAGLATAGAPGRNPAAATPHAMADAIDNPVDNALTGAPADLGDIQAVGHALIEATHPAVRGALLARLDTARLQAVGQFLARNPPAFDGARTHVAMDDAERYGDWLTARADVEAHLRGGELFEQLATYLLDPTLDARAVATLAALPDALEVAEVIAARGQRDTMLQRLAGLEAGARGDAETRDVVEQARLVLTLDDEE
ncbi:MULTISPECIES: hypothetical protein [unclassified Cupriavidus]|uniref:hypothetical protein n=1 Tax=Cupriavidus sp. H19C3 TaxID=3241603 RepID=UPI003BF826F2